MTRGPREQIFQRGVDLAQERIRAAHPEVEYLLRYGSPDRDPRLTVVWVLFQRADHLPAYLGLDEARPAGIPDAEWDLLQGLRQIIVNALAESGWTWGPPMIGAESLSRVMADGSNPWLYFR